MSLKKTNRGGVKEKSPEKNPPCRRRFWMPAERIKGCRETAPHNSPERGRPGQGSQNGGGVLRPLTSGASDCPAGKDRVVHSNINRKKSEVGHRKGWGKSGVGARVGAGQGRTSILKSTARGGAIPERFSPNRAIQDAAQHHNGHAPDLRRSDELRRKTLGRKRTGPLRQKKGRARRGQRITRIKRQRAGSATLTKRRLGSGQDRTGVGVHRGEPSG